MMKLYDVYDNGTLVLTQAQRKKVISFLGGVEISLHHYCTNGQMYKGRYLITESNADSLVWEEWDRTIMLFHNVKWVHKGGRHLQLHMNEGVKY